MPPALSPACPGIYRHTSTMPLGRTKCRLLHGSSCLPEDCTGTALLLCHCGLPTTGRAWGLTPPQHLYHLTCLPPPATPLPYRICLLHLPGTGLHVWTAASATAAVGHSAPAAVHISYLLDTCTRVSRRMPLTACWTATSCLPWTAFWRDTCLPLPPAAREPPGYCTATIPGRTWDTSLPHCIS